MKPFLSDFEQYLQARWCDHVPDRCDSHTLHFVTITQQMLLSPEAVVYISYNCLDCLFTFEWWRGSIHTARNQGLNSDQNRDQDDLVLYLNRDIDLNQEWHE